MATDAGPRLDNLTLARKEGWQQFVDATRRQTPERLSRKQIRALGDRARMEYERARRMWHANLNPIRTPQLAKLHEDLWDIVDSNAQDGDKPKGAVAIDAFPGLGKTTASTSTSAGYASSTYGAKDRSWRSRRSWACQTRPWPGWPPRTASPPDQPASPATRT
jgi:type II secretory pathway pseudopilin PulG